MTFADFCLFWIARDAIEGVRSVTATFNGEFVGSAGIGDLVECRGEVVKAARSMVFVRGIISNASRDGEPMMSFSSVLKKTARK
jgi:acyl-coenzyme A thioesterase PaaI-like protein